MPYKDIKKQKEVQRKWYQEHKDIVRGRTRGTRSQRRQKIARIKSKPCMDCKIEYPYYVMQFDHRGEVPKIANVNALISRGTWKSVLEEIEKCDVVCANCHAIRTYKRLHNGGLAQSVEQCALNTSVIGSSPIAFT